MKPSSILRVLAGVTLCLVGCSDEPTAPSPTPAPAVVDFTGSFSTVDASGYIIDDPKLAVGVDGRPRAAYQWTAEYHEHEASGPGTIKFAAWNAGSWTVETVSSDGQDARSPSLVLEPNGRPVVSYSVQLTAFVSELWCSRRQDDGRWESELVDADGFVGSWSAPAFDATGHLHLAYFAGYPNYDLRYAIRTDAGWQHEVVETTGETGYDVTIRIDDGGVVHLGYGRIDTRVLRHAARAGTGWDLETIAPFDDGPVGISTGAAKSTGFVIKGNGTFEAIRNGPDWTFESIDPTAGSGISPRGYEQDDEGRLWVAYSAEFDQRIAWKQDGWHHRSIASLYTGSFWRADAVVKPAGGVMVLFTNERGELIHGDIDPVFETAS